jgi:electron-transferring-flavoprotein dehydrogenase
MPPLGGDGWMIIGDSAGFLNSQRLKGIHLGIKSGMLAAETAFEGMLKDDFSAAQLSTFQDRVENSWIKKELWLTRNFHQGFEHGFIEGMIHTALQQVTFGRGLWERYVNAAGHERMQHLETLSPGGDERAHMIGHARGDGKLAFDKLTDLYHSGTKHEEDQPSHLVVHDTNVCATRCVVEFGNPCQYFCPASVYEIEEAGDVPGGKQLRINASNCVHCKTCDIMDPYQIITWVPPEGGGGPNYDGM